MTMDEIVRRLEKAEKKIAALEETLETIKQMNISEQMQEYIESRQRTVQLTGLLNSLSGQGVVDTTEAKRQIVQAQAKKSAVDKQIAEALAAASNIDVDNATPAELFTYERCAAGAYGGVRITGYNGFDEAIIAIPKHILGKAVISIGEKAFLNGTMEEVILPKSIIEICSSAFENCNKLRKINIPNNVISIGEKAFSGCKALSEIILPQSVEKLGNSCFSATGIKKINFPGRINEIPWCCCSNCEDLTEVSIEEGVSIIGHGAFWAYFGKRRNQLKSIVIPKSVTLIRQEAFRDRDGTHIAILGSSTEGEKKDIVWSDLIASSRAIFYVIPGSAMQRYARENNLPMKSLKEFPLK